MEKKMQEHITEEFCKRKTLIMPDIKNTKSNNN
jgi:hypothetical protein